MSRFEAFRLHQATISETYFWEKDMELNKRLAKVDRNVGFEAQYDVIKSVVYTIEDLRKVFRSDNY